MEEFPSNSHTSKVAARTEKPAAEETKKVEKVITGKAATRKKPLSRRFLETFGGGDAKSVMGYVVGEVLVPAFKDMVADAVSQGVERLIFGEVRSSSRRPGSRPGMNNGYVSYNRYAANPAPTGRVRMSRRARATHNFDEIILDTKGDADQVIDTLFEIISKYQVATVADLYDACGLEMSYTDDKYGWTDIRGAGVTRVSNGYLLDLPRPVELD